MTVEAKREELAAKYFVKMPVTPTGAYAKFAIGAFALILGMATSAFFIVVGLGVLIWGAIGYAGYQGEYKRATPRATDRQMDRWLEKALEPIVERGLLRLNIHPTELNQTLPANKQRLVFVGIPSNAQYRSAWGVDGKRRYSAYQILVVYLSTERMPIYECVYDMVTGTTFTDGTKEYGLDKVDGMQTSSDRVTVFAPPAPGQPPSSAVGTHTMQQFISLNVSGSIVVRLAIGIAESERVQIEQVASFQGGSEVDMMISGLREHLRAARAGALGHQAGLQGPANAVSGAHLGLPEVGLDLPPLNPELPPMPMRVEDQTA